MNAVVIYNTTNGKLVSKQDMNSDCDYLIVDIPTNKQVIKVNLDTKEPIFDDTNDIKQKKGQIEDAINKKQFEIQTNQLEIDKTNYRILKQQSELLELVYFSIQ